MPKPPLRTECPHCKCKMEVDPLNGEVLAHEPPPEGFAEAEKRASGQAKQERQDAFDAALSAEKSRAKDLDDLFKQASEAQDKDDDSEDPGHALDDKWR